MVTKQSLAAKVKNPANWIANVLINETDLLRYCGSLYDAALMESRMNGMGWRWARAGSFVSNNEGPCFVFAGANSTRYNIRPWKKASGQYVWRCHHPSFKQGDELAEFLDPVSCAVAQEIANG